MEQRTLVRCAEGHLFGTAAFPMQQLQAGRLGPGRLLRCPRCGRLRNSVPADVSELSEVQLARGLRM
ncbi:hypothetical protein ACFYS8_12440 [Kitasatospora sp. NPDC004615]|uniref:hypothetical protein n=1 Tax=unclassified Kitasatospora TaxID=2633591 RepID=UPI00367845C9